MASPRWDEPAARAIALGLDAVVEAVVRFPADRLPEEAVRQIASLTGGQVELGETVEVGTPCRPDRTVSRG